MAVKIRPSYNDHLLLAACKVEPPPSQETDIAGVEPAITHEGS
jgi:hypothetical protein